MRLPVILLVLPMLFSSIEHAQAQRSKVTKTRYHKPMPKVKGQKAKTICPVFTNSRYPFHGLGGKLGDPFALSYKFYARKHLAVAVDFGKAASGLYSDYFRGKFDTYAASDTFPSAESRLAYVGHRVKTDFVGEVKVLYHIDASRFSEGLQLYAGVGWEWKKSEITYDYEYRTDIATGREDPFGSFTRTRVTMGPQVTAGMEYSYFTIPISAFMEVEYFADFQADPGWRKFQGGVGIRYIFQ